MVGATLLPIKQFKGPEAELETDVDYLWSFTWEKILEKVSRAGLKMSGLTFLLIGNFFYWHAITIEKKEFEIFSRPKF